MKNLQKGLDYWAVNKDVWKIFINTYGGGPVIKRRDIDIYSEEAIEGEKLKKNLVFLWKLSSK